MSASGGRRLSTSVCPSTNYLVSASNNSRTKVAILLTDGQGEGGRAQARTAADRNITIHTIGFGGADGNKLSDIAQITNGTYNYVDDASDLPNVFSRVAEEVEPEDSDGDGLPDVLEENGLPIGHTGTDLRQLPTNATDKHTDGDELTDGEEAEEYREYPIDFVVNDLEHEYIASYFELRSNPTLADSDGDGLEDHEEVYLGNNTEANGWTISVINESGQPYRWAGSVDENPDANITVTSDPMLKDTDGDGLTDAEEKEETHTDPREDLTYTVGDVPRGLVSDIKNGEQPVVYSRGHEGYDTRTRHFYEASYGLLNLNQPEAPLTDATADYDFVTAGSAPQAGEGTYTVTEAWEKLTFMALDGTTRTDIAMSNAVELENDLDPWDPDSDDDGLTDGQEHNWLTHVPVDTGYVANHEVTHDRTLGTDPLNSDTDGDGYWDGWIGVYDVDYSDNVILYRENLQSGNGISGDDERVDKQAGVHVVHPEDPGAYLDNLPGSSVKRHSNVHLGELHWDSFDPSQTADPTNDSVTPNPQLTVEVDYHSSVATTGIVNESLDKAERTYQLYGLNITYVKDQNITKQDPFGGKEIDTLPYYLMPDFSDGLSQVQKRQYWENVRTPSPGLAGVNEDLNHEIEDSAYLFITYDGDGSGNLIGEFDWTRDPNGVASCQGADFRCKQWSLDKLNFGTVVLHKDIADDPSPYHTHAAKTIVHETGHLIGAGRDDDGSIAGLLPEEVYSGGGTDETPEEVGYSGPESDEWSVMSSGWNDPIDNSPMRGEYIAFSIEELIALEFNGIDAIE